MNARVWSSMSTPLFTSMSMYTYVSGDAGLDVCYVHVGVDVHYVYFHVRVHVHVYVYGAVGLDVCYVQLGVDVYIYIYICIHMCTYINCRGHILYMVLVTSLSGCVSLNTM